MIKVLILVVSSALAAFASGITPCADHLGESVLGNQFQCSQGGLVFNNFVAPGTDSVPVARMYLVSAYNDPQGNAVLEFNPFLLATGGQTVTVNFGFQVSNPVAGIALTTSGLGGSISELVCGGPVVNGACTKNAVANITAASQSTSGMAFAQSTPVYVYKTITVGSTTSQPGEISSFYQTFTPYQYYNGGSAGYEAIPEPSTIVLLGAGLGVLFAFRRRAVS